MNNKTQKKGEYIVFKPDYIWLINKHNKLFLYRFEIYAVINAYFCCIIWIYVKVLNCMSLLVVCQFF
jgi:hypothetical protein